MFSRNNHKYVMKERDTQLGPSYSIKFTRGKYKGVEIAYGLVRLIDNGEDVAPTLRFTYDVLENPKRRDLKDNNRFEHLLGDILTEIIIEQSEKVGYVDEFKQPEDF